MSSAAVPALRVAMIGYAFMGAAHSQAWRTAGHVADLPLRPEMAVVVGRPSEAGRRAAGGGWAGGRATTDWRRVIERDDIDLVDICTPGDTHAEIAVAALAAGKHVLCEKPLANTVAEAEAMVAAARPRAGVAGDGRVSPIAGRRRSRWPATWSRTARSARVRQVRAQYLQDWLADEQVPLTWRLDKDRAGSGALGDIGAHIIDAVEFVTGQRLTGVSGMTETFVKQRPVAAEGVRRGPRWGAAAGDRLRSGHRRRRRSVLRQAGIGRAGRVRGHPVRAGSKERHAIRDQRHPGQSRVRLREHECAASTTTRAASGRGRRVHPDSGHRAVASRTCRPGGHRVTGWATSTVSPIR